MPTKKAKPKPPADSPKKERLKPLSLWPMTPEEAIAAIGKVDPQKVEERLKEKGIKRNNK